jgi:hypothetical protein
LLHTYLHLARIICYYQPQFARSFFTDSSGCTYLLSNALLIFKGIGLRLIGREHNYSGLASPVFPPPISLLSSFISFLVTIGISVQEYEQIFQLKGGIAALEEGPTPQWCDGAIATVVFLGYVRVNLFTQSPTELQEVFERQCANWRSFGLILNHLKEHSVSSWVRLCVHYASQFPEKKKAIMSSIWVHYCQHLNGNDLGMWGEEAVIFIRNLLCLFKILVATYGPEIVSFLRPIILSKRNLSYTVHQWCAEVRHNMSK